MTQVRHGIEELLSAPLLASGIYHVRIFLKISVDALQKVRIYRVFRKNGVTGYLINPHLGSHLEGIVQNLRMVRKNRFHLLTALEIFLLGIMQTGRVLHQGICRNTYQTIVHRPVLTTEKMHVVGSYDLDIHLFGQFKHLLADQFLAVIRIKAQILDLRLMEHHLQIIILSEYLFMPIYGLPRGINIPGSDVLCDLPRKTSRRTDKILVIFLYDLVTYPRLIIKPLHVSGGHYLHKVLIAFVVFRQKDEMVIPRLSLLMVEMTCHVDLAAYDRLDDIRPVRILVRLVVRHLEKFRHTVHITVVSNGDGRHTKFPGTREKLLDVRQTVKNGILRMQMEMDK